MKWPSIEKRTKPVFKLFFRRTMSGHKRTNTNRTATQIHNRSTTTVDLIFWFTRIERLGDVLMKSGLAEVGRKWGENICPEHALHPAPTAAVDAVIYFYRPTGNSVCTPGADQ